MRKRKLLYNICVFGVTFLFIVTTGISIFDENLKYIFYSGKDELYDQKKDLFELKDISGKNQFLTLYMKQKLFYELFRSLRLKKRLNVKEVLKKVDKEYMIRELKSLGYL